MKLRTSFVTLGALFVTHLQSSAAPENAPNDTPANAPDYVKFKTQKVIVFKDGYSLVIKKGTGAPDERGEVHTLDVPDAAVLGSFWATSDSAGLLGMRAGWRTDVETKEIEEPAADNLQILLVNVGKSCKVVLTSGEEFDGTIREVLSRETQSGVNPQVASALSSQFFASNARERSFAPVAPAMTMTSQTASHFVLRTGAGDRLLPVKQVRSLLIPEMVTKTKKKVKSETKTKRLTFRFKPEGDKKDRAKAREITMMYFRPGVRWIPTYRINLPEKGKKMAEISLQAEILNEAEDLIDVPVDIVVGVPNFRFRNTPSPLALESVLRNTLNQAEPALMGQMRNDFSNASYASRLGEFRRAGAAATGAAQAGINLPGELTAGGAKDLFVYSLPNLRLRKGDRAAVSIFDAKVPCRDVYTWDLQISRHDIATAPSGAGVESPLKLSTNKVWHQVELTNTTKVPWTTGAAMIMLGQQPLAQELLTYTSPKDACRVPVTVSVDTRGSLTEKEIDRTLKSLTWESRHYALIHNKVTLDLCNNKPEDIDVEITVKLGGRVEEATKDGMVTLLPFDANDWQNYRGSPAVNNSSQVKWKVKLKAGETFLPEIDYKYYARH